MASRDPTHEWKDRGNKDEGKVPVGASDAIVSLCPENMLAAIVAIQTATSAIREGANKLLPKIILEELMRLSHSSHGCLGEFVATPDATSQSTVVHTVMGKAWLQAFYSLPGLWDQKGSVNVFVPWLQAALASDGITQSTVEMLPLIHGDQTVGFVGLGRASEMALVVRTEALEPVLRAAAQAMTLVRLHQEANLGYERLRSFHAAKLASLGEMAGGIAHEINNPLAIIQGAARKLRRLLPAQMASDEDLLRPLESIEATSLRIAKIVKGLRSFARDGERDPYTVIKVNTLVEETLSLCRERFVSHGIPLFTGDVADNLTVECQVAQIAQVLLNLINNAFDAVEGLEERWVAVSAQALDEDYFELAVMDAGTGIARERLPKLMQPFFTTKPVGSGTGLGLSIAKGIAEGHGGSLYYDEASPRTRFVLRLPRLPVGTKGQTP